jgi:hypothetical protein
LLQFEASEPRPVWAILDSAGARRFTGQVTLHLEPTVFTYFQDGEIYLAEREGDAPFAQRLIEYGVLSDTELEAGTVRLGGIQHLGRLFERVPSLNRDQVELALEVITSELVGEIADHTVLTTTIATYRHHPSGVNKWFRKLGAPTTNETGSSEEPWADEVLTEEAVAEEAVAAIAEFHRSLMEETPDLEVVADELSIDPDDLIIPEAPSYYAPDSPAPATLTATSLTPATAVRFDPPTTPAAGIPGILTPGTITPGTITERIWFRDPLLDPEPASRPDEREAERVTEPATQSHAQPAPQPASEWADEVRRDVQRERPAHVEFDLSRVIDAVAKENDGVTVPFGNDADIDESVRAAVREALAEIQAATRPRPVDDLSPALLQRALDSVPDYVPDHISDAIGNRSDIGADPLIDDPNRPPWLPDRATRQTASTGPSTPVDATKPEEHTGTHSAQPTDGSATGLRRLIGGSRKP